MWWRMKSTWMTIASPARFYLDDKFCCQGQGHPGRAGSTRRSVTVLLAVYRCVALALTGTLSSIEPLKRLEVVLLADNSLQGNLPRFEGWNWLH